MTRGGLEARVGLTVVVAGIILVVGTMWFQKFQLVEKRYSVYARFDQVGGLVSGDPIVVNGVESGRVEAVDLGADDVVVELAVREGVTIPEDSYVALKSIGIMGERFVAITKGSSPHPLSPGDSTSGTFLAGLSEVMGEVGSILDEIAETSRNLREMLDTLNEQGKLQTTMTNLSDVSERLRAITDENQPRLANAIDRFDRVATMMDSLIGSHYASLDSSMAAFGRSGPRVETVLDDLEAISGDLREVTAALRGDDGSLGKLINDGEMATRLESAIAGLDSLVTDMRLHPGRYVTVKLF